MKSLSESELGPLLAYMMPSQTAPYRRRELSKTPLTSKQRAVRKANKAAKQSRVRNRK